ncbi:MAG TPA: histidine kinase [Solirubrobacteraceae bacterium]|jgi:signal transduction histidine kinase|nr:histidine kinase [Solirubrobacteraceae bacterium]
MTIRQPSMLRLPGWDVGLAVAASAAAIVETAIREGGSLPVAAYLLAPVATAPLAWRRQAPVPALIGVALGAFVVAVALSAPWTATVMLIVELYTVALYGDRNRSLLIGALSALAVVVTIVLIDGHFDLGSIAIRVPLVLAAIAIGDTRRARLALAAATTEREARLERDRQEESRRRVQAARLDVARDVHDTLAHALVEINVRAGVAAHVKGEDPATALAYIKQTSARALADLRGTLSVVRDAGESAPTAPTAGLEAVPELVRRARQAGLAADAEIHIDGAAVPSAVGHVGFRVVQEGLTNVLRHADASTTHVVILLNDDELEIAVTDDGRGGAASATGYGLRGMGERVAALGGVLDAGPTQHGGWRIRARLPLTARGHA